MNVILKFLRDRLDERSTWRAIVALLTVGGVSLHPDKTQAIIAAGVAIGALIEALLPDPAGKVGIIAQKEETPQRRDSDKGKQNKSYLGDSAE